MPRWQLPERWASSTAVPKTSVGKFDKTRMRDAYANGDYEVVEATLSGSFFRAIVSCRALLCHPRAVHNGTFWGPAPR